MSNLSMIGMSNFIGLLIGFYVGNEAFMDYGIGGIMALAMVATLNQMDRSQK